MYNFFVLNLSVGNKKSSNPRKIDCFNRGFLVKLESERHLNLKKR